MEKIESQAMNVTHYSPGSLQSLAYDLLRGFGCHDEEAGIVSTHLVGANLAGHDSHGIGMLPLYGMNIAAGHLFPNQVPELFDPVGAVSVVDARLGFGHRMALLALDHALKQVPEHKVAILAMRNSGHVSRLGTYSEYCGRKGYVSIHMVNVTGHPPLVAPFGARETGFSTNPISIGMPHEDGAKPMLDMATSTIAFGKVRVANNTGVEVPPGSLIDAEGVETRDPKPMAEERIGALAAFGAHKGSGLGIFVELLTGALGGLGTVASAPELENAVINNMFSIIIDPSAFDEPEAVARRVADYYDYVREKSPAKGVTQVLMPGDPENISRAKCSKSGIAVDDETLGQISATADSVGLDGTKLVSKLQRM
ncbi:MAG: malate dehydrogenase [Hyphomicrobiales bacterium]|nr:MAG: malate dehydrogenase [Hyphomicrobiales bacterium]